MEVEIIGPVEASRRTNWALLALLVVAIALVVILFLLISFVPPSTGEFVERSSTDCIGGSQTVFFECIPNPRTGLACWNGGSLSFAGKTEVRACANRIPAAHFVLTSRSQCMPVAPGSQRRLREEVFTCEGVSSVSNSSQRNECTRLETLSTQQGDIITIKQYEIGESFTQSVDCSV